MFALYLADLPAGAPAEAADATRLPSIHQNRPQPKTPPLATKPDTETARRNHESDCTNQNIPFVSRM